MAEAVAHGPASALLRVRGLRGRDVALKVFRVAGTPADQAYLRTHLLADWRIWSEVAHPHVLPVSDFGEGNDSLYVATRWVEGRSLRAVLHERRTLDAAEIRPLAKQLASALDAAAAAWLVHLDVKPENVLFTSDGMEHALVRDFGAGRIAAWKAGAGRSSTFHGTLEYAAPEQIEGHAVDGRTVVYSLGCLLYETFTGATPYAGRSSTALRRAHVDEPPPPTGRGAAVDRVFATALAKRRDERYATCAEFADALGAALTSAPAPRPARATRRRPVVNLRRATVVACAAFAAAAVATAASWFTQSAPGASDAAPDKPLSTREFMAALPSAAPTVKAARKQIRVAPSRTRAATRKASSAARANHQSVVRTSPAPVNTAATHPATSGTTTITPPSAAHHASAPAAPRPSSPPETTTAAAAPAPLAPPPPPPQDPTPPLPPPPP